MITVHDLLRLTDRDTVRAMRRLYQAGSSGEPQMWLNRSELVELGYAEYFHDAHHAHPWRTRLTETGRTVVEVLLNPTPKGA